MPLVSVCYEGELAITFQHYNSLPDNEKHGHVWDNNADISIVNIKKFIKDHYILAQNYTCPYCQQRIEVNHNASWDAEHIIPKSTHPKFIFEPLNLCVSCKDCNNEKRNKPVLANINRRTLPTNSADYIIVHPHLDNYNENIKVIEIAGYYLPMTEKGRKTIETCGLLRFTYKYTNYGNTSQRSKETIQELANSLMEASTPEEENMYLSIIADTVEQGQQVSKAAFLEQVRVRR